MRRRVLFSIVLTFAAMPLRAQDTRIVEPTSRQMATDPTTIETWSSDSGCGNSAP